MDSCLEGRQEPIFMGEAKWCGHDSRGNPTYRKNNDGKRVLLDEVPEIAQRFEARRYDPDGFEPDHRGFILPHNEVVNSILVPRYYNPEIAEEIGRLGSEHEFVTLGELIKKKAVSLATGIEIGKMAYGTGTIPFIRTSDISNWEIKADFKHGVSEAIYEESKAKIDVQAGDIFMVKDGTYLVGTCAIVTHYDLPMLFQSHLYRIRVLKPEVIDPWLLFALLNTPIVRLQVRSKQFTQDIIDTIGKRVVELAIPVPRDKERAKRIAAECRRIIEMRVRLRHEASTLVSSVGALTVAEVGIDDDV